MDKIRKFPLSQDTGITVSGLGILTDEPDYRLCWLLNQHYSWDLVKSADLVITDKNSPVSQSYPCFTSSSAHSPAIRIIGNRSREGVWLTVFRQVDFLLIAAVQDPAEQYINELKTSLSTKIPQIRGLFKVPLPSFCYL